MLKVGGLSAILEGGKEFKIFAKTINFLWISKVFFGLQKSFPDFKNLLCMDFKILLCLDFSILLWISKVLFVWISKSFFAWISKVLILWGDSNWGMLIYRKSTLCGSYKLQNMSLNEMCFCSWLYLYSFEVKNIETHAKSLSSLNIWTTASVKSLPSCLILMYSLLVNSFIFRAYL